MDIRNTLRIGDRLDIKLGDNQYRTRIVAIESALAFVVVCLGDEPIPEEFGVNSLTLVTSYNNIGKDEFESKILYRGFKHSGMPALRLEATSEITRIQRRDFYRLPIEIAVRFVVLSKEGVTLDRELYDATTIDLGEGGMLIRSKYGYAVDSELECHFEIAQADAVMNVIVRRSDFDVTEQGSLEFQMGLQFASSSSEIKQHIAKFVMQHQIRSRNRVKI